VALPAELTVPSASGLYRTWTTNFRIFDCKLLSKSKLSTYS